MKSSSRSGGLEGKMSQEKANEAIEANIKVCNHMYTFIYSMSLKCAVQLGIPEALARHPNPVSIDELAASLPQLNPSKAAFLTHLMQLLAQAGYFKEHNQTYALTPASEILLPDHPYTVRPYLLAMLDPALLKPWATLSSWFQNDDPTPFGTANGMEMWDFAAAEPEFNDHFNESMASDSRLAAALLVRSPGWKGVFEGVASLVDVGGGTGEMARAVADVYPHIQCTVLDLPHVVGGLQEQQQGTPNLSFVAGDMFQAIPPADALLLKRILHDWDDENAVKILKNCRKALEGARRGKLMIIDMVMGSENTDNRSRETQQFWSMQMMVLVGGKERNESEWAHLFLEAGFTRGYNILPGLGLRSLIQVYP